MRQQPGVVSSPSRATEPGDFARAVVGLLRSQAGLVVAGAVLAMLIVHPRAGFGVLAGGGVGLLLTALAAVRTVMVPADSGIAGMVGAFYRAMAMKLLAAMLLFAVVARWFAGDFGPVLIGYVATLVAYWLAMWRLAHIGQE